MRSGIARSSKVWKALLSRGFCGLSSPRNFPLLTVDQAVQITRTMLRVFPVKMTNG